MVSWWPSCPNTEIWISSSLTGETTLGEWWHAFLLMDGSEWQSNRKENLNGDKNNFVICIVECCQQIHQKTGFGSAFLRVWHPYVAARRQENSRRHFRGWGIWLVSAQPNVRGVCHQLSRRFGDQHEAFLYVHALTCRGERDFSKTIYFCCAFFVSFIYFHY